MNLTATAQRPIRVLIVDDHFFARMGVSSALSQEGDIGVVAEAASGREAIDLYELHRPDVAVLDGQLPDMHGADVAREIVKRHRGARLLIFSVEDTEEDVHRAVTAGVNGYVLKSAPRGELVNAVRSVATGARFFSEGVLDKLQQRRKHSPLSTRETEVLQAMARGLSNKLVAVEMGVSMETVKTFVTRILEKFGAVDRVGAVVTAMERGYLKRR
jgi:DNA-binding NarL/FixJ family response regulator